MEKRTAIAILQAEMMDTTSEDVAGIVYELIVKKRFSPIQIRDKCIYADFIKLFGTDTMRGIYDELAAKYDTSQPNIVRIIGEANGRNYRK